MDNQIKTKCLKIYEAIGHLTMAMYLVCIANTAYAEQSNEKSLEPKLQQYQIELLADFSHLKQTNTKAKWLSPLANGIDAEYFIAQNGGEIYLLDSENPQNQNTVLNLSLYNPEFIGLSAMSIHPSFGLPDQPGYATFYTAHTVKFAPSQYTNRIAVDDSTLDFEYETVITAWTYDFNKKQFDSQSQREVLRLPISSQENAIQQLKFEPYLKPWNKNYGLLYFSLKYIESLKDHGLYSGAILRVSPLMFGARNYTVPATNPFIKNPEINDEVVIMGGRDINDFFWAKYSHESIFIRHQTEEQDWISKARTGVNLQEQTLLEDIWQSPIKMASALLYQGRNFLSLRNKMMYFTLRNNEWQLTSIDLQTLHSESPSIEKVLTVAGLSGDSELSIHQNQHNEIVIFDNQQSKLYALQKNTPTSNQQQDLQANTAESGSLFIILLVLLLIVLLVTLLYIYRKNSAYKRAIYPLDKGYVRFEYDLRKESILLFKIKQNKAHKTLHFKEISRCEILLNNQSIIVFDNDPNNAISNKLETEIRNHFIKEHDKKMQEDHTRQIEVILSDNNGSYTICLYLRKGNNRVTGNKYFTTVDILLDLCWMVSKHINSHTETRTVTLVPFSRPNIVNSARQVAKPLSDQPSEAKSITKTPPKPSSIEVHANEQDLKESPPATSEKQQTDVVEALEKLVKLHEQGYLTDQEFTLAKSNLLQ